MKDLLTIFMEFYACFDKLQILYHRKKDKNYPSIIDPNELNINSDSNTDSLGS